MGSSTLSVILTSICVATDKILCIVIACLLRHESNSSRNTVQRDAE